MKLLLLVPWLLDVSSDRTDYWPDRSLKYRTSEGNACVSPFARMTLRRQNGTVEACDWKVREGMILRFGPAVPLIKNSMRVGTSWTAKILLEKQPIDFSATVLRKEWIAVPAGRFECLVVSMKWNFVTTNFTMQQTVWFAPGVGPVRIRHLQVGRGLEFEETAELVAD